MQPPTVLRPSGKIRAVSTSAIEVRILGSLIEKEHVTPEAYPLSTNAVLLACNQKSNREPVVSFHLQDVEEALRLLASKGLVSSAMASGERVVKHSHRLSGILGLKRREMALLAVLMLRGAQTAGELRTRAERHHRFGSLEEVEESLRVLSASEPPLVRNTGRLPGQSQDRWVDTFSPDPEKQRPRVRASKTESSNGPASAAGASPDLEERLERLQAELDHLYAELGFSKPGPA